MARVKLGDVAREYKATIKNNAGLPIVGLEHLIPGEITLEQWDTDTSNTFTKGFKKGHMLFGRRRAYLKKAALAPFDGICSGDITVIEAIPEKMNPDLLPFIIQNDLLFDYAVGQSAGSLSPRVKWENLKEYEFELPELEKQYGLVELLKAAHRAKKAYQKQISATDELVKSQFIEMFGAPENNTHKYPVVSLAEIADEFFAGGDKPSDVSETMTNEYYYPVYANGIECEGLQCYAKTFRVDKPAVTVSARGTIGYTFVRNQSFTPIVRLITIVPKPVVKTVFLKYAIDNLSIERTGTSQAQLTVPDFKKKQIVLPPIALQECFLQLAEQSDKSKFELQEAIARIDNFIKSLIQQDDN